MSDILKSIPKHDGYRMPAEYETHHGCLMIWPTRPGSWIYEGKGAKSAFSQVALSIAKSENLYMLADKEHVKEAEDYLMKKKLEMEQQGAHFQKVKVIEMETDDAWARDVGPTFVVNDKKQIRGIDWQFNAWGGEYDGLYASWDKDDQVANKFCKILEKDIYDAKHFVLEGGSIHVDGEGTALVTEACLLSPGRNPKMSKEEIENMLKDYLNVEKVIWIVHGIYQDETNEHVDNVCAFVKPGEVVLAWTDDENDPQYAYSKECLDILEKEKDAKGRAIKVHKLYIPQIPVTLTEKECAGYVFEEGEDEREVGERLAASYVNFYIANKAVIVPQFRDCNDKKAIEVLEAIFPDREMIPIQARDIIVGGGNIHCITQQIPEF